MAMRLTKSELKEKDTLVKRLETARDVVHTSMVQVSTENGALVVRPCVSNVVLIDTTRR